MNSAKTAFQYRLQSPKKGSRVYDKISYPVHCGTYSELETADYIFHFNLNHEIVRARKKCHQWGHPHEWLKRTAGNDWNYYSTGGYTGVFEATGEYYLPNFRYPTNNLLGGQPFLQTEVAELVDNWHQILSGIRDRVCCSLPGGKVRDEHGLLLEKMVANSPQLLEDKARRLFEIIGGRVSVMPPDARHVDYNVIPVNVSRGCLYKCQFCRVKNAAVYSELSPRQITSQLEQLRILYGRDLDNYNSIFLGEQDALQAKPSLIVEALSQGINLLGLARSYISGTNSFFFGSVSSLLGAPSQLFQELQQIPGNVNINIGLESADQKTLDQIGKPVTATLVREAFRRIQEINQKFSTIEISANFIMDETLPDGHYPSIIELIRDSLVRRKPKGTIYFSPLSFNRPSRARLFTFNRLKVLSRLPTYLYIIQRL
jgi:hypothetical protein